MTKVVLIGAGSVSFGTGTLCDLFAAREELKGSTVALVDVNPEALRVMAQVARRMNEATGEPFVIEATADRREALPGAQFVIISIAVKRNERWRLDFQQGHSPHRSLSDRHGHRRCRQHERVLGPAAVPQHAARHLWPAGPVVRPRHEPTRHA